MKGTIKDFMIKEPIVIKYTESLMQLIELFEMVGVSHLIVINEWKQVVGIISRSDISKKLQYLSNNTTGGTYTEKYLKGTTAGDIMTKNPISLKPEDSLEYAAELLLQKQFHSLPVVRDDEPVGIITVFDVMKAYYQDAEINQKLRA